MWPLRRPGAHRSRNPGRRAEVAPMTARPQRRRLRALFALITAVLLVQAGPARAASARFGDVPRGYWAGAAIQFVAQNHNWMRDFGSSTFRPDQTESRKRLARAAVRAFAPAESPDPSIHFADLPSDDRFFPFANVAVKLGWIRTSGPNFRPDASVSMVGLHRTLVLAVGLADAVRGINAIHTSDGYRFRHGIALGYLLTGILLGLRYNHSDESLDVGPSTRVPRSE